jgi:uncharacterized protein (TIGR00255 family)
LQTASIILREYNEKIISTEQLKGIPRIGQGIRDKIDEYLKTGKIKEYEDLKNSSVDQNRLEQEMIFYIEKMDVSEEKIRLSNHLDYFMETLKIPLSGKKLGFIAQEIGREINTLGSKSNHIEMQKLVVEMKDNLEKIKEQVLNVL